MIKINNCRYCGKKIRPIKGIYEDRQYHRSCEAEAKDFIFEIGKKFSLWCDTKQDFEQTHCVAVKNE